MTLVEDGGADGLGQGGETRWSNATEQTLRILVDKYVKLGVERNAIFLAERLYALNQSQENLYILANSYMRAGQNHRAYHVLQKEMDLLEKELELFSEDFKRLHLDSQIRYLFAKCCFELGKYREAEAILVKGTPLTTTGPQMCIMEILTDCRIPNGAAGLYLLGLICAKENRRDHAFAFFALTLKCDPFMWDAYEQLCHLGLDMDPRAFFGAGHNSSFWEFNADGTLSIDPAAASFFMETGLLAENEREVQAADKTSDPRKMMKFSLAPVPVPVRNPIPLRKEGFARLQDIRYISALSIQKDSSQESATSRAGRPRRSSREEAFPSQEEPRLIPLGFTVGNTARFSWPSLAQASMSAAEIVTLDEVDQSRIIGAEQISSKSMAAFSTILQHEEDDSRHQYLHRRTQRRPSREIPPQDDPNQTGGDDPFGGGGNIGMTNNRGMWSNSEEEHYSRQKKVPEDFFDAENQFTSQNKRNLTFNTANPAPSFTKGYNDYEPRDDDYPYNEGDARAARPDFGRVRQRSSRPEDSDEVTLDSIFGAVQVLGLLERFGQCVLHLSQYRCTEALEGFSDLPTNQQNTGWVAHQKGKACFEMGEYRRAMVEFQKMRRFSPDRAAGLEVFSTNLWHLKEEVELCYLAQQAVELDKKSPEAWCAIGNCFSLQKEHDVAIKFFQRALQLDPSFTYAYTLSGHEYVSNEDFEKAVACYRHAIRTDPRHYNAWYGLGTIYYRQEKYDLAEYHFRRAISINPRSSVLHCYLGMVQHASQKYEDSLRALQTASDLEPTNPQAKFQRALVLRTMQCYDAALDELEAVKNFAPRESSVHFLIGKICKQLGRKEEALLAFTTALDLDPKDSNMIKLAIDKLDNPNDNDETDGL